MKFTNKFTLITIFIVLGCLVFVVGGGVMSFIAEVRLNHRHNMNAVAKVVEYQLNQHTEKQAFNTWLPDLLKTSGILHFEVRRNNKLFLDYRLDAQALPASELEVYEYHVKSYTGDLFIFKTRKPYKRLNFSFFPLIEIIIATAISLLLLVFSIYWIKKLFKGAELLDQRAKSLLQGNPAKSITQKEEWPIYASKALDMLNAEFIQNKQQLGRFDEHIRSQVFLDKTTGLFNRLAFENRLDITLKDENVFSSALFIISFPELDFMRSGRKDKIHKNMLLQIAEVLTSYAIRYNDQFQSRINSTEFALIFPQLSYAETIIAAKQLTNILFQLQLPESFYIANFFAIGVSCFQSGEKQSVILDDAYDALKVAYHLKESSWFLADEASKQLSLSKGTVKWRSLFANVVEKDLSVLFYQRVLELDNLHEVYCELFLRIPDFENNMISASIFSPMEKKCGLKDFFDKKMLEKVFSLLKKRGEKATPIAINLTANLLVDSKYQQRLVLELMGLSIKLRNNLIFEFSEHFMEKNNNLKYYYLRKNLITLKALGCKIAIDNVGKTVVNTEYIADLSIDYLKLHASLVHNIHLRTINQVAIQSIRASCLYEETKLVAVGIETNDELEMLRKLGVYGGQGFLFGEQKKLID